MTKAITLSGILSKQMKDVLGQKPPTFTLFQHAKHFNFLRNKVFIRKIFTIVSGINNNKVCESATYTGLEYVLWYPPSAVHRFDAKALEIR